MWVAPSVDVSVAWIWSVGWATAGVVSNMGRASVDAEGGMCVDFKGWAGADRVMVWIGVGWIGIAWVDDQRR